MMHTLHSLSDLMVALDTRKPRVLELAASIVSPHSLALPCGFTLQGNANSNAALSFSEGGELGLSGNNVVSDLE